MPLQKLTRLCTRFVSSALYALQKLGGQLDQNGDTKIKVRSFIAFDTPNRGSDVPMALQATIRYLNEQDDRTKIFQNNLLSKAGGQMLIKQIKGERTGDRSQQILDYENPAEEHGKFMREINAPTFIQNLNNFRPYMGFTDNPACQVNSNQCQGMPGDANCAVSPNSTQCPNTNDYLRTVAIANGQSDGPGYGNAAATKYLAMKHTHCAFSTFFGCAARVNLARFELITSNPGNLGKVFSGEILTQNEYRYDLREPVLIEDVPGGFLPLYSTVRGMGENAYREKGGTAGAWNKTNLTSYDICPFVPTISAAGVVSPSININSTGSWFLSEAFIRNNNLSLFDQLYFSPNNTRHVSVTPDIAAFLLSMLN